MGDRLCIVVVVVRARTTSSRRWWWWWWWWWSVERFALARVLADGWFERG
jgi:hypothetical protein